MLRFALLAAFALPPSGLAAEPTAIDGPQYDWGVAYYMSYDNDLERNGPPILRMIRDGLKTRNVVAAVQADFRDPGGMHRYTIRHDGHDEARVASEDSASEEQLVEYLRWFAATFRCKNYVVILLDHGGGLDQMCRDDAPATPGRTWMSGQALGKRLRAFDGMRGKFPLLFLQQCGRGSLENLYSFRGTAEFLMASPLSVGAPNTYYTRFHEWLARNPEATGHDLAIHIATFDDHYTSYACYLGEALDELPARLETVTDALTERSRLAPPKALQAAYPPAGTVHVEPFLKDLAAENGLAVQEVDDFLEWMHGRLVAQTWVRTPSGLETGRSRGVSLAPPGPATRKEDAALDLLKPSGLAEVWKRLEARPAPTGR